MIQETVFKGEVIKRSPYANPNYANSFLMLYQKISHELRYIDKTIIKLTTKDPDNNDEIGMNSKWMNERMTGIKGCFEKALGSH